MRNKSVALSGSATREHLDNSITHGFDVKTRAKAAVSVRNVNSLPVILDPGSIEFQWDEVRLIAPIRRTPGACQFSEGQLPGFQASDVWLGSCEPFFSSLNLSFSYSFFKFLFTFAAATNRVKVWSSFVGATSLKARFFSHSLSVRPFPPAVAHIFTVKISVAKENRELWRDVLRVCNSSSLGTPQSAYTPDYLDILRETT